MKKATYTLQYKDILNRTQTREYKANGLVYIWDDCKLFCRVNHYRGAKIITPQGKEYYL